MSLDFVLECLGLLAIGALLAKLCWTAFRESVLWVVRPSFEELKQSARSLRAEIGSEVRSLEIGDQGLRDALRCLELRLTVKK